jgi:hypothetical protein
MPSKGFEPSRLSWGLDVGCHSMGACKACHASAQLSRSYEVELQGSQMVPTEARTQKSTTQEADVCAHDVAIAAYGSQMFLNFML